MYCCAWRERGASTRVPERTVFGTTFVIVASAANSLYLALSHIAKTTMTDQFGCHETDSDMPDMQPGNGTMIVGEDGVSEETHWGDGIHIYLYISVPLMIASSYIISKAIMDNRRVLATDVEPDFREFAGHDGRTVRERRQNARQQLIVLGEAWEDNGLWHYTIPYVDGLTASALVGFSMASPIALAFTECNSLNYWLSAIPLAMLFSIAPFLRIVDFSSVAIVGPLPALHQYLYAFSKNVFPDYAKAALSSWMDMYLLKTVGDVLINEIPDGLFAVKLSATILNWVGFICASSVVTRWTADFSMRIDARPDMQDFLYEQPVLAFLDDYLLYPLIWLDQNVLYRENSWSKFLLDRIEPIWLAILSYVGSVGIIMRFFGLETESLPAIAASLFGLKLLIMVTRVLVNSKVTTMAPEAPQGGVYASQCCVRRAMLADAQDSLETEPLNQTDATAVKPSSTTQDPAAEI